jgi:hypothetical protein
MSLERVALCDPSHTILGMCQVQSRRGAFWVYCSHNALRIDILEQASAAGR